MRVGNGATALKVVAEEQEPEDVSPVGVAAARAAVVSAVDDRRDPASEAG
jgi:hypothetical protein